MKTILMTVAFFGMVALLTIDDHKMGTQHSFSAYFPVTEALQAGEPKDLPAVIVKQEERGGDFIIEFKNFSPAWRTQLFSGWRSRQLNHLKFTVSSESCQFLQTEPEVFNCDFDKTNGVIGSTEVDGAQVELESLWSGLVSASYMVRDKRLSAKESYAVEGSLKVGGKRFPFSVMTAVQMVNMVKATTVAALPANAAN